MGKLTKNTITRGMVAALALSAGATTANAAVTRVSGADRYATATQVLNAWPTVATSAVLAAGAGHDVDALTVAPLAKQKNAPIILVDTTATTAAIVAQFANFTTVYIANGSGVISENVKAALTAAGKTVVRLGGANRYETALNIAKAFGTANNIVIANGDDAHLVDSLSIASIAAAKGMPIFLSTSTSLDSAEATYAKGLGATNVYVLGGTTLVSDASVAGLGTEVRLAGAGRYETNAKIVTNFKSDAALDLSNVYIASGEDANLIDSLVAAPLAGLKKAPIVFAHSSLNADVNTLLTGVIDAKTNITVIGGTGAVSAAAFSAIQNIQTPGSGNTGNLSASSVSAISATSMKVVFNQAPADTTKVVFTVQQATAPVTVTATWNAAKTEAILTKSSNFTAGDYSVAIKSDTTDLGTSKVTISEQKIAKINITSSKLGVTDTVSGDSSTQVGYATYNVLDQYSNDITNSALGNNVQFQTGVGTATGSKGLLTITPSTGLNLLTFNSGIVVTGNDTNTGVSTSATLIATSQIGTLSDMSLTTLTNADGKILTAGDTTDIFYAGFTATDISGNPTTNYTLMKQGLILGTGDYLTTSSPYVTAQLKQDPADSTKGVIEVRATGDAISLDMPVVITAMTWTGKTSQISTTLKKQAAIDTFTLMAPTDSIASGEENEIPFTALDQNGVAITKFSDLDKIVTLTGAYFYQNVDGTASVKNTAVTNNGTSSVPDVISAVTPTGKYSSITVNIQKAVKADSLSIDTSILKSTMQQASALTKDSNGNITAYNNDGATELLDFGWDKGGISAKDQYGRVIDMTTESKASDYVVVATSSAISVINATGTATSGASHISIKAGAIGSATVTFNLYDVTQKDKDGNVIFNGSNYTALTAIDSKSQTFTVLKDNDVKGYTIDAVTSPIYTAAVTADNVAGVIAKGEVADYNANPGIYGTTSTGGKVVLRGTPILGASVDSSDFGVFNLTNGTDAAADAVKVIAYKLADATKTGSSTTLSVTLLGADGNVHTVTTPIKSSTAAPQTVSMDASVATQVAGISRSGDVITLTAAKANGASYADLLGTTLGKYDSAGTVGTKNVYFAPNDQYGVTSTSLSQFVTVASKTTADDTAIHIATNGDITYGVGTISVNDVLTVSGISSNGLIKTIEIDFK